MAILHRATLNPSKLEILTRHLRNFPNLCGVSASDVEQLGAYRFDDPAGVVGIETHLLRVGAEVAHIPLTYRAAPVSGAEQWLIETMEHSVLGTRWVYDACGDPVYVRELVRTILTGGTHVEQYVESDSGPVHRPSTATVAGSGFESALVPSVDSMQVSREGNETVVRIGAIVTVIRHHVTHSPAGPCGATLAGQWAGVEAPIVLAYIR